MNGWDILITALLATAAAGAAALTFRRKRKGGCGCGCSGCDACAGCEEGRKQG